jgi:hypothetical protein
MAQSNGQFLSFIYFITQSSPNFYYIHLYLDNLEMLGTLGLSL